jgi:tripartite-type tricarboxylate transporter receptor subunit TctC
MAELGWKDLVTSSWQGVLVPAGTPRAIIDKLHAAISRVLADPKVQARMRSAGAIAIASRSPEDFKTYLDIEAARWAKVIQQAGVRAD